MAGIKKFPLMGNNELQIFEYSDTLSLAIDDAQKHLKPGDPVVINKEAGIAGILMSEVAPKDEKTNYATAAEALTKPTYGLNRAQHASVRVKGGVFILYVAGTAPSPFKPGTPVYLKAAAPGAKPTVTFTKAGADVMLGWAKEIYSAADMVSVYQVVLDTRPLA